MKVYVFHGAQWCTGDLGPSGDIRRFLHLHFGKEPVTHHHVRDNLVILPYRMSSVYDPVVLSLQDNPPKLCALFADHFQSLPAENDALSTLWLKIQKSNCLRLKEPGWMVQTYDPEAPYWSYHTAFDECLRRSCIRAVERAGRAHKALKQKSENKECAHSLLMQNAGVCFADIQNILATVSLVGENKT